MPCNDTTSRIVVHLDGDECLVDFDFSKITCGGKIKSGAGYAEFCQGMAIDEILRIDYETMVERMALKNETDRFLLYLEWSTLRSSLSQYKGLEAGDRTKMASISYSTTGIELHLVVKPPKEMPKRVPPCSQQKV